jgi:hypothetical protein
LPCAGFQEEVFSVGEELHVEEFRFDALVDGFDVGLVVLFAGRDESVLGAQGGFDEAGESAIVARPAFGAGELRPVVALDGCAAREGESRAPQVRAYGGGEAAGVGL